VSYDYGMPVIFGVLTTDTDEQADARSGAREGARLGATGAGGCNRGINRGYDAGLAAIEMANLMKRLAALPKPTRRGAGTTTRRPARKRMR